MAIDERRDIAQRLRELADYCDENEMSLSDDDWPGILSDYIWPEDSGYHTYDDDCRRLADLIEPEPERTCRNLNPPSCRDFECSECGESSEFTPGFMPNYCPHCGARVEEASDDADR